MQIVFRDGNPVAMIDFDAAAPGLRSHDLGYAAWLWLDLGSPEFGPVGQARRLTAFLDGYGSLEPGPVLDAMLERQALLAAQGRQDGDSALADWADGCREWTRRNVATLRATRP